MYLPQRRWDTYMSCHVPQRRWDTYMSCTCLRGGGTHTCHVPASEEVGHIHVMYLPQRRWDTYMSCHVPQRRWDTYMSCTCLRGGGTHTCHVPASEEVGHIHVMSCASEEMGHIHVMYLPQRRWDTYMSCTCLRGGGTHTCHVMCLRIVLYLYLNYLKGQILHAGRSTP